MQQYLEHLWLPSFACQNISQAGLSHRHCNKQTTWGKKGKFSKELIYSSNLIKSLKSSMKLQLMTPLLRSWAEQSNSSNASTCKRTDGLKKSGNIYSDDHLCLQDRQSFQEFFSTHSSQRPSILPSFHFAEVKCRRSEEEKENRNKSTETIQHFFVGRRKCTSR